MPHPSVKELAKQYFTALGLPSREIQSFYFCDNEQDANECAELVLSGDKRATAASLWWYETNGLALPKKVTFILLLIGMV